MFLCLSLADAIKQLHCFSVLTSLRHFSATCSSSEHAARLEKCITAKGCGVSGQSEPAFTPPPSPPGLSPTGNAYSEPFGVLCFDSLSISESCGAHTADRQTDTHTQPRPRARAIRHKGEKCKHNEGGQRTKEGMAGGGMRGEAATCSRKSSSSCRCSERATTSSAI